jgi:endo-1,4-beta-xylanase
MMPRSSQVLRLYGAVVACIAAAAITSCKSSGADGDEEGRAGISSAEATGGGETGNSGGVVGSGGLRVIAGTMAAGGTRPTGGSTAAGGERAIGGLTGSGGSPNPGGGGSAMGGSTGGGGSLAIGGLTSSGGSMMTGGVSGDAGLTGSGGSPRVIGGDTGSGGALMTGGMSSNGGSSDTGGVAGEGSGGSGMAGTTATGGVSGDGGSASTGGVAGEGGGGGAVGGTTSTCPSAMPLTGGTEYCSNNKGNAGHGYAFELWASGSGSGCMTVYGVDAAFGATWDGVEDFLARAGLDFDQTKTHTQIGNILADFAETKAGDDGFLYVGIYGWTLSPLREYYILDDWGTTKPGGTASDGTPRTFAGTITVDGDDYDVWTKTRVNKPNITGQDQTFDQYFSIRKTARQCGRISISQHFTQWEALGLPLGNLYEAKLLVEAQDNSGSIEFTTATVVVE